MGEKTEKFRIGRRGGLENCQLLCKIFLGHNSFLQKKYFKTKVCSQGKIYFDFC